MNDFSAPSLTKTAEPQPPNPSPINTLVVAAIAERRLLKLAYSAGNRIVEPHVYGLGRDGRAFLRCYQVGGESLSRERYGWKLLRGEAIGHVEVLDVSFVPRTGYTPEDRTIQRIYARV